MNKQKLQKLISKFDGFEQKTSNGVRAFEQELSQLVHKMRSEVTLTTVESVNQEMSRIKRMIDFRPIVNSVESLKTEINQGFKEIGGISGELRGDYLTVLNRFEESISKYEEFNSKIKSFPGGIEKVYSDIQDQLISRDKKLYDSLEKTTKEIYSNKGDSKKPIAEFSKELKDFRLEIAKIVTSNKKELDDLRESITRVRSESFARIGGGNMNRQMKVNGTDVLTKYTDIDIVGGTGITISAVASDTKKNVGITITGSGNFQAPTSGSVDGVNATFVWATAPMVIVIDSGRIIRKTSSDGTVNWTGTTTTILTIAPTFDVFAIA